MHPTVRHDLANARIADLHRQAERRALVQAAIGPSHAERRRPADLLSARTARLLARQLLILLSVRGYRTG